MRPTNSVEALLGHYRSLGADDLCEQFVETLLAKADGDVACEEALFYVLNEEARGETRLRIVEYIGNRRSSKAVAALTKELFDPDKRVRAAAAQALDDYGSARLVADSLSAMLDATADAATRSPCQRMIRAITGVAPEKISVSERERLRLGEHPQTIWSEHYAALPFD